MVANANSKSLLNPLLSAGQKKQVARSGKDHLAGRHIWPGLAADVLLPEEEFLLKKYQPSGVVLFRRNLTDLMQAKRYIAQIKSLVPGCVIAIDEEGGRVARLPWPVPRGLTALQLGDMDSLGWAENQFLLQSFVAKGLGVDCILAPVADVLSEETNPVLYERCYSRNVEQVSKFVKAAVKIIEGEGILSCLKHFPGHGNTTTDTHLQGAVTYAPLELLRKREWPPFVAGFGAGAKLCMTCHVLVNELDAARPATLSPNILQNYLREELGFRGLILSDDLRMKAIERHFGVNHKIVSSNVTEEPVGLAGGTNSGYLPEAAEAALRAGCDIILCCQSIVLEREIFEHVANLVDQNRGFVEILTAKNAYFSYAGLA